MSETPLPNIPVKFRLSPEFRLLAACSWIAPPALEQGQAEKITSLCSGEIDWKGFLALVVRHGVPALAYTVLCRHAGDLIPQNIRYTLKNDHIQTAGQALFQAAELVRLIKLFAGYGIALIPLKGVFLSYQLYGDMGLRTSSDLDLLVKEEQIDLAVKILVAEGYIYDYLGFELTERQKQHVRTNIHHFDFVHSKSGLHVELHWNLGLWLIPGQLQVLLNHSTLCEWQGVSVNCLDDDANLLLLCDHGSRHEWFSLKWLGDVARLFSSTRSTSWETLVALAAEIDLLRTLAHSALMVHWIYGVTLPHELYTLIRQESRSTFLSKRAMKALLMGGGELARLGNRGQKLRDAMIMVRLRPSIPYRLIAKFCLVPPDDFLVLNLPASLFWLYYPLRPILWIWRHYIRPIK